MKRGAGDILPGVMGVSPSPKIPQDWGTQGVDKRSMIRKRNKEGGFTFMELMIALLIVIVLTAVVMLVVRGFFSSAREASLEEDLHSVKNAVDAYSLQAFNWPTASGQLPPPGGYFLIDFNASFTQEGKTLSLYPHFLRKLPRHANEGVWRIDNAGLVSVDMAPEDY